MTAQALACVTATVNRTESRKSPWNMEHCIHHGKCWLEFTFTTCLYNFCLGVNLMRTLQHVSNSRSAGQIWPITSFYMANQNLACVWLSWSLYQCVLDRLNAMVKWWVTNTQCVSHNFSSQIPILIKCTVIIQLCRLFIYIYIRIF